MAKKKWLDHEEQLAWRGVIATAALMAPALDHQLQRDAGVSHAQYAILARLARAPKCSMHMSELAALLTSSPSRLSHAVARLEEQGWTSRSRCPVNGRAVHVTLTESGRQLVKDAAPGHARELRRLLFDQLSREQVLQLIEMTSTTLQVMSDEGYAVPSW